MASWGWATRRRIKKRFRGYFPNMSHNKPEFLGYVYPKITREDVEERIKRFSQLLGYEEEIKVAPFGNLFFRIYT
jgi:hypothetical protein